MGIAQTKPDLIRHLREQVMFLKASCNSFDEGFIGEAKRLATTIRVMLHDTNTSHSLFGQLGWKSKMSFFDSAMDNAPGNIASYQGLIGMRLNAADSSFFPLLDNCPYPMRTTDFKSWWHRVIIIDSSRNKFKRRDIVLNTTNQDGGAHIDPSLNDSYAKLTRDHSIGWFYGMGNEPGLPFTDPHLYSIRQIAYEILKSLDEYKQSAINSTNL